MVYWFSCCSKNDDYTVLLRSQSVIELYVFSNCEVEVPSVADVKSEFPFFWGYQDYSVGNCESLISNHNYDGLGL